MLALVFQFIIFIPFSFAQLYNRIEADFTVKEKSIDGSQNLYSGKVFFDLNYQKIVYSIQFPKKSTIVITPSALWVIENGEIISKTDGEHLVRFSIFQLTLKGSLDNFGLEDSPFELSKVERTGEMVISTWKLPKQLIDVKSKIMLSQINKNLYGMVSFDVEGNILSKHVFEDYKVVKGIGFPTKVIQFNYLNGETQNTRITTYRNIQINNTGNEDYYNYHIPGH